MIGTILGLGVGVFALLYIAFNLEDKHQVVKGFALFFALFTLVLIAKTSIDDTRTCDLVLINETDTMSATNITDKIFQYDTICYDTTENTATPNIYFRLVLGFISIVFIYLIGFLFWFGGGYLKEVIKK